MLYVLIVLIVLVSLGTRALRAVCRGRAGDGESRSSAAGDRAQEGMAAPGVGRRRPRILGRPSPFAPRGPRGQADW